MENNMESVKVVIISEDTSILVNLKKKLADKDIQIVGINCLTINGILNNQKFQTK